MFLKGVMFNSTQWPWAKLYMVSKHGLCQTETTSVWLSKLIMNKVTCSTDFEQQIPVTLCNTSKAVQEQIISKMLSLYTVFSKPLNLKVLNTRWPLPYWRISWSACDIKVVKLKINIFTLTSFARLLWWSMKISLFVAYIHNFRNNDMITGDLFVVLLLLLSDWHLHYVCYW